MVADCGHVACFFCRFFCFHFCLTTFSTHLHQLHCQLHPLHQHLVHLEPALVGGILTFGHLMVSVLTTTRVGILTFGHLMVSVLTTTR